MNIEILIKNVKDNFLEVYPEISFDFDSDEHDGQNAFEVALVARSCFWPEASLGAMYLVFMLCC